METLILQQVIADQRKMISRKERGITRFIETARHIQSAQISVISGIRRSGKSTLMLQIADQYPDYHFFTFDDERLLNFNVSDFNSLMIEFTKHNESRTFFFDEVQNVEGWEKFVRRLHDQEYKIYISGSNSKLLSSELATHLTGRYIKTELYPFSFREFLSVRQIDLKDSSTENLARQTGAFDEYLAAGGFPEFSTTGDPEYLKRIYEDIIYRDLIVRFGIKNINGFRNLVRYMFTNFTRETNYNSLATNLGFSSTTSVRDYISFLSEAYLVFEIYRYDFSLKRQYLSNKKIYVIDNGLRNAVSFRTGGDRGRMLENLVFIELKRREEECWYYKTTNNLEVDFLWFSDKPHLAQVCYDLTDPSTMAREMKSLERAMQELSVDDSVIFSYKEKREIETPSGIIRVIPVMDWLTGRE